jgi:hypothetical protein
MVATIDIVIALLEVGTATVPFVSKGPISRTASYILDRVLPKYDVPQILKNSAADIVAQFCLHQPVVIPYVF